MRTREENGAAHEVKILEWVVSRSRETLTL